MRLELVVDEIRLGLNVPDSLLHALPRLQVRPVAVGLGADVLPQASGREGGSKQ